jgi:hypothetical protein
MAHIVIASTLALGTAAVAAAMPPVGIALGLLALGAGLFAKGDK